MAPDDGLFLLASQCRSFMDDLLASHSTDLQQRAYELQVFLGLSPNIVQKVLPVNGSGEEIEVCALLVPKNFSNFQTTGYWC